MIDQKRSHPVFVGVSVLLLWWGSGYCKPPILEETHLTYHATVDRLLNPEVKPPYLVANDSDFVNGDVYHLAYPRSYILNNLTCWSNWGIPPVCQTTIFHTDSSTRIFEPSQYHLNTDNSVYPVIRRFMVSTSDENFKVKRVYRLTDSDLVNVLGIDDHNISHIQIYKKEKLSRSWIAMEDGYLLVPVFLGAMLFESTVGKQELGGYSWGRVAGETGLVLGVYSGARLADWTDETRIQVIDIKF